MASKKPLSIRLEFSSAFEMVDFVEVVGGHVCRDIGLDEDAVHWVGVAIRECVINAIKHGNHHDLSKRVFVEFDDAAERRAARSRSACATRARDSIPETIADPLAPENLLKGSGRGIFLIRNFMDEVELQRAPEGGMEVLMVKRVQSQDANGDSLSA